MVPVSMHIPISSPGDSHRNQSKKKNGRNKHTNDQWSIVFYIVTACYCSFTSIYLSILNRVYTHSVNHVYLPLCFHQHLFQRDMARFHMATIDAVNLCYVSVKIFFVFSGCEFQPKGFMKMRKPRWYRKSDISTQYIRYKKRVKRQIPVSTTPIGPRWKHIQSKETVCSSTTLDLVSKEWDRWQMWPSRRAPMSMHMLTCTCNHHF